MTTSIQEVKNSQYRQYAGTAGLALFTAISFWQQRKYVKEIKYILKHPSMPSSENYKSLRSLIKTAIEYRDCAGMGNGGQKLLMWTILAGLSTVATLLGGVLTACSHKMILQYEQDQKNSETKTI